MRKVVSASLERCRIQDGAMGSDWSFGMTGAFKLKDLLMISSGDKDGTGWEHVSVSKQDGVPTWGEMCLVKALFWSEDECVIQFHPPARDYVNVHPNCLHLWRPVDGRVTLPPKELIA